MQKFFAKFHPRLSLIALVVLLGVISLAFSLYFMLQAVNTRQTARLHVHFQTCVETAQALEHALLKEAFLGLLVKRLPGTENAKSSELQELHNAVQLQAEAELSGLLTAVSELKLQRPGIRDSKFEETLTRFTRAWREQRRQWQSIPGDQIFDWFHRHTVLISKLNLALAQLRHHSYLSHAALDDQRLLQESSKRFSIDVIEEAALRFLNSETDERLQVSRQLQLRDQLLLEDYLFHSMPQSIALTHAQEGFSDCISKLKYWRIRWQNSTVWQQDAALIERWASELIEVLEGVSTFRQGFNDVWQKRNESELRQADLQFWLAQVLVLIAIMACLAISAVAVQGFFRPLRQLRNDLDSIVNGRVEHTLDYPLPIPVYSRIYQSLNQVREQLTYREHILEERTAFFEHCPEIIATLDWEGRFYDTNEAFHRILGFNKESLLGLMYLELVHPLDRSRFIDSSRRLIEEKEVLRMEIRCLKRNGQFIWLQFHAVALQKNQLIYCVASDISIIKKTEAELLAAKEVAENANAAKTEFLANMSHEIRTPINGILGAAQIIQDTQMDSHQQEFMSILTQSAEGLLNVVNDILDISKIEAGRLELDAQPFDLELLGTGVIEHASMDVAKQEKRVEILFEYAGELATWYLGDDKRLRQVLLNLMSNAVKFTQEGHVLLSVRGRQVEQTVDLEIRVEDTGIGIPEDRQRSIFEKFTQADASTTRQFGGTGLGLAICSGIVAEMDGALSVTSTMDKGSTFTLAVRFPLAPDRPLPVKQKADRGLAVVISSHKRSNQNHVWLLRRLGFVALGLNDIADWQEALHSSMVPVERVNLLLIDLDWGVFENSSSISGLIEHPVFAKAQWVYMGYGSLDVLNAMGEEQHYLKKPLTVAKLRHLEFLNQPKRVLPAIAKAVKWVPEHQSSRVLVVEDNKVNSKIVMRLLQRLGIETELAENGVEALDLLAVDSQFDLVLMDCQMPLMDGYEATRQIRKLPAPASQIVIVAMTAHAMEGDRERCLAAGMDDYMSKPIDFKLLEDKLVHYLRHHDDTAPI